MFEKEFENLFRSFQELRDSQAELSKRLTEEQAESDRKLKIQMAETDELIKKVAERQAKTDEQMAETDKRIDKVNKQVGGIANNNGFVAEDFFWSSLKNKKELFGIKVDYATKCVNRSEGKLKDEFDILLWNGNSVIVVEIKYRLHPNDLEKFKNKKIPNFKALFPERQGHKIYGALASWSIPDEVKEQAKELGFLILSQAGQKLSIEADELKAY